MARWEPDARGRMQHAAMELYTERGYEQTTVADIADRAGVTERTYFRHFADKREVLFEGSGDLKAAIVDAVTAAPVANSPLEVVGSAMENAAVTFRATRDQARARAAVIAANPSLQERELLKLSTLGAAVAETLHARGVAELPARVAAEAGMMAFSIGFERWISDVSSDDFTVCVREVLDELADLGGGRREAV